MTKPKDKGGPQSVNPKITRAINKLVDEVMKEPKEGETGPSLTDKMKVLDRALKHEAIRLKIQDSGEGGFFKQPQEGADDASE